MDDKGVAQVRSLCDSRGVGDIVDASALQLGLLFQVAFLGSAAALLVSHFPLVTRMTGLL